MGNVQGQLTFRVHNGSVQSSSDNGATWATIGGTVTTDATLTGAGTVGSPLGINTSNVTVMSDVAAIAGGSVTDLTVSGLAGETDGNYEIDYNLIIQGAGTIELHLRPFGASDSNLLSSVLVCNTNVVQAFAQQAGLILGYCSSGGVQMRFAGRAFLQSKSGQWRFFEATSREVRATPIYEQSRCVGHASDTATVITDLTIHATVASSILVGSKMVVRKLAMALL